MKHLMASTLTALVLALPAAAQDGFGPLIAPQDLSAATTAADAPLVLDIRAGDAKGYGGGHIPGAVSAPYGLFRGPAENPGALPTEDHLTEVLRGLGVTPDRPTVIVHQGSNETDFGAAARVYWTLKSSGVSQLAILNGGVNGWTAAGLPLSQETVTPDPSDITVSFSDRWLATEADVLAVVEGRDDALLLDARPEAFWSGKTGHDAAARPGTLPQSKYFEHAGWFRNGPAIVDADAARSLAAEQGFSGEEQIVSFCNTGHWAATNWFALSELAGIENVKMYPESMVGWSNAGHQMANAPGLIQNLWHQIRSAF